MPKLEIKSSAVAKDTHVRILLFGGPDKGKTMAGATAPIPVWVLTEDTCKESMTQDIIEAAFPIPSDEAIKKWLVEVKKVKVKEVDKAFENLSLDDLKEMTGITYDMPRVDLFDMKNLKDVVETLRDSPFETVIFDSASVLSKKLLDHLVATGGKDGKPLKDKRQAYDKAADEVINFFRELYKLPKHLVFICRGVEFSVNKGTVDEPVFIKYLKPGFEGQKLGRGIPHDIRNIFQSTSRTGDNGKQQFFFRTRKATSDEWERTNSPHLADEEPADLTALFRKILKK